MRKKGEKDPSFWFEEKHGEIILKARTEKGTLKEILKIKEGDITSLWEISKTKDGGIKLKAYISGDLFLERDGDNCIKIL